MNITATMVRLARTTLTVVALAAVSSCADKELTGSRVAYSPRIALQITATNLPAQMGPSPLYLLTGAVYATPSRDQYKDDDGIRILAFKWTRVVQGTQQITLPVDIAPCLADPTRLGTKDGCSMYLAAFITPDSIDVASDTGSADPMMHAFDYAFPVGPFDVVPGRTPVVPPLDLSLSRFGVVNWQPDDALRLGGKVNPNFVGGVLGGIGPITGVAAGTGEPVLYSLSFGATFASTTTNQPLDFTNYPQLQIFQNGNWQRVTATTAPAGTGFRDVTAVATNDVYIAGTAGLFRFDGSAISRVSAISDSLFAVGSTGSGSSRSVIAAGNGAAWIGDGTTFTRFTLPSSARFDGACITGPGEAFVSSSTSGSVYRYNGSSWQATPGVTGAGGVDLQCPGPGQAYVMMAGGGPLLKWAASGWSPLPTTGITPGRRLRWGVVSASEIWAYADSGNYDRAYFRFDGTRWNEVARTRYHMGTPGRPWADPRGGSAYAMSAFGRLERVTSSGKTVLSYQPALRDAIMTSQSSAFVIGWNNFLARWNGSQWIVDPAPAGLQWTRMFQGVWSDGPNNAWVVGSAGTILRFDGSKWSTVADAGSPVTTGTESFHGVWGAGTDVWVAGDNGITRCKATGGCALEFSSTAIFGIWGTSASNVFAVGSGGKVLRYNGSAWSAMTSPTSRLLVRLSGTSASDVWAVGDSVVIRFDGTQWSDVKLSDHPGFMRSRAIASGQIPFQIGIWARSPKEVYLGSEYGMIARWDGQEWHEMLPFAQYRRRIVAITGAKDGCGLAIAEGLSDLPGSMIWRGVGPSGCFSSPMTPPSVWP